MKLHKVDSLGWGNLTDYHFSQGHQHDSPHLGIAESWRGFGLIADLEYASMGRIADCERHRVHDVIRLKEDWTATVEHVAIGLIADERAHESDVTFDYEESISIPDQ